MEENQSEYSSAILIKFFRIFCGLNPDFFITGIDQINWLSVNNINKYEGF